MTGVTPGKIVCVGRNYVAHARELGNDVPSVPMLFLKPPSAVIAHGEAIVLPPESGRVEYEAEIGVVLGRRIRRASPDEALAAVHGFTCANDVTARDLQKTDGQWGRAKGFDTFCPVGPCVTSAHALPDPQQLALSLTVNGKTWQKASTAQMIFPVAAIIEFVSAIVTLEPGDIISTGTPSGVGNTTGTYLKPGDQMEAAIASIGVLRNHLVAE